MPFRELGRIEGFFKRLRLLGRCKGRNMGGNRGIGGDDSGASKGFLKSGGGFSFSDGSSKWWKIEFRFFLLESKRRNNGRRNNRRIFAERFEME